jgi:hypothetical protein
MLRWPDGAKAFQRSLGPAALLVVAACSERVSLGSWLPVVQPTTTQPAQPPPPSTEQPGLVQPPDASVAPTSAPDSGMPEGPEVIVEAGAPTAAPTPAPPASDAAMAVEAGAPPDGGAPFPACGVGGDPGELNQAGLAIGGTATNTDWIWPQPLDSVEFEFAVEAEVSEDTYYWAYEFGFVAGARGLLGMQANGYYQADPPDGEIEETKMVQFWIGGPPLDAELGDVADARAAEEVAGGVPGRSIQTKFPWEPCHVYRFRLGLDGTDEAGNRWYGATVVDTTTGVSSYLGHMLIPLDWGRLATTSTMWAERYPTTATLSCGAVQYSSVVFGHPIGNAGIAPTSYTNRFGPAEECGTSRFTEFANAIRHEVGVP